MKEFTFKCLRDKMKNDTIKKTEVYNLYELVIKNGTKIRKICHQQFDAVFDCVLWIRICDSAD